MSSPGRPFLAGRLAGGRIGRRPLAPLVVALLLLGWELGLAALTGRLVARVLESALAARALFPGGLALALVVLIGCALLMPVVGFGLAWVESGAALALPRTARSLAGLVTLGLLGGIASAGAQACLLTTVVAAVRRRVLGGGIVESALLWALPSMPALLLGALASGAPLLGVALISSGELEAQTPAAALHVFGRSSADLLRQPLRTGAAFSALLLITSPFSLGAVFLGMAGLLIRRSPAREAFLLGSSLSASTALLWVASGLRLALSPDDASHASHDDASPPSRLPGTAVLE